MTSNKKAPKRRKNETDEEFRERHRKFIAEISKDINYNFTPTATEEEREQEYQELFRKEELKYGKIVRAAPTEKTKTEQKIIKPKSVVEMRRQLVGPVTGYGIIVGVTEQYVVVSRTTAMCSGQVRCACDAVREEHMRPCGYSVDTRHNPPVPDNNLLV